MTDQPNLSPCKQCYYVTRIIDGACGKCGAVKETGHKPFTVSELRAWTYRDDYFVEVLNGEKPLDEARDDLRSFRNTKYYTGDDTELAQLNQAEEEKR